MRLKVCCLLPATAYRSLGARSAVRGPQGGNLVAELCRHNFMTHDTCSRFAQGSLLPSRKERFTPARAGCSPSGSKLPGQKREQAPALQS